MALEIENDVTVVIVNYNAGQFLGDAVESCLSQAGMVIVVDNASKDQSIEKISLRFEGNSRLKIIRNKVNLGFSAGCNIGANAACSRFVLFLNPDCNLEGAAVRELVNVLLLNPKIGMVGGLILNSDGTEQIGCRRVVPTPWRSLVRVLNLPKKIINWWPKLFSDFNLHLTPLPSIPIEVEAISGACMMVKSDAINDVGLFNEIYFMHCEDLDLCMRYRQRGWKIFFVPSARIIHHRGVSSRNTPIFVQWHKHLGMIKFYMVFFRHQYSSILMCLIMLAVALRFITIVFVLIFKRLVSVIKKVVWPMYILLFSN